MFKKCYNLLRSFVERLKNTLHNQRYNLGSHCINLFKHWSLNSYCRENILRVPFISAMTTQLVYVFT